MLVEELIAEFNQAHDRSVAGIEPEFRFAQGTTVGRQRPGAAQRHRIRCNREPSADANGPRPAGRVRLAPFTILSGTALDEVERKFVVRQLTLFGGYKVRAAAEYLALEMGSAWRAVPDGDRKGVCGGSRFAAFGLSRRRGGESVPRRSRNSSPEV